MYLATVRVTLRPSILDPQGKTIRHALHSLGYGAVEEVRTGKLIQLTIQADSPEEAERVASDAAGRLLANPVMEDFTVEVEALEASP